MQDEVGRAEAVEAGEALPPGNKESEEDVVWEPSEKDVAVNTPPAVVLKLSEVLDVGMAVLSVPSGVRFSEAVSNGTEPVEVAFDGAELVLNFSGGGETVGMALVDQPQVGHTGKVVRSTVRVERMTAISDAASRWMASVRHSHNHCFCNRLVESDRASYEVCG